jgi:signal transduction histidine kinase
MADLLSDTATRLRAQAPEILGRWEARVLTEVPAASTVDTGVLYDHLHILLEQVVTALSPNASEQTPVGLTPSERHGAERALLESYSLSEVLQEYSVLRRTVLEVLDEGRPMALPERHIINDALEQALIGASTQYALVQYRAEHARAEEARAETATLLQSDQHKNEFLAWLAHELRTPLAAISNALYILDRLELRDDRAARQIATATRQTRHLSRLVEDLLDLSRISRGTLELRSERLDLRRPVLDAAEASKPLMDEHGQELVCSLGEEPLWVNGDPVRLVQAIANLLNNAARYSKKGGRVRLSVERDGDHAVVRVQDSGIGIDPAVLPRIFEPFVQVDSSSLQARKGLGIGLAVVRRLVEMHGGQVTAHSKGLGHGAEFAIRIPLERG